MHYADWKPSTTASQFESIVWIFSPGHAGVLGNERADLFAGSAEIRGTLIMDPPAVRAAVKEMLTATRTGVSFTLEGKETGSLRWETRHASWVSQTTFQPDADGDGQHPHAKMEAAAERGVFMDDF